MLWGSAYLWLKRDGFVRSKPTGLSFLHSTVEHSMLPVLTSNVQEISFLRENIQVKKYSYYCLEQECFLLEDSAPLAEVQI